MMRVLNWVFGLFGYEWVRETAPYERENDDPITDEGWDDLYEHPPRYRLKKKF